MNDIFGSPAFDRMVQEQRARLENDRQKHEEATLRAREAAATALDEVGELLSIAKQVSERAGAHHGPTFALYRRVRRTGFRAWLSGPDFTAEGPMAYGWKLHNAFTGSYNAARVEASTDGERGVMLDTDGILHTFTWREVPAGAGAPPSDEGYEMEALDSVEAVSQVPIEPTGEATRRALVQYLAAFAATLP
jgi:hypothetical protein